MNRKIFSALLVAVSLLSAQANAGSIVVHPSNNDTLSKDQVARIFLGKLKEFPSGETASPISLAENTDVTQKFVSDILKKSPAQLKSYWAKLIFTGQGEPPVMLSSEDELIKKVASTPGMIGFVSSDAPPGVKVVATF